MKKIILALLPVFFVVGCAPSDPNPLGNPALKEEASAPLYCNGTEQCNEYWQRAQLWVTESSAWKIQTVTDTVISTYPPIDPYPWRTAYIITKEPLGEGRYQFKVKPYCENDAHKCNPKILPAAVGFKRYVSGKSSNPLEWMQLLD